MVLVLPLCTLVDMRRLGFALFRRPKDPEHLIYGVDLLNHLGDTAVDCDVKQVP